MEGGQSLGRRSHLYRSHPRSISVGEGSTLDGSGLVIRDAEFGVVSKDASTATISGSTLSEIRRIALLTFNKKPQYGPAALVASGIEFDGSGALQLAQRGNTLTIDGKRMYTQRVDVQSLYQDGLDGR